jgi:septal ring factor EnvC (AmiA/AmiB activator)
MSPENKARVASYQSHQIASFRQYCAQRSESRKTLERKLEKTEAKLKAVTAERDAFFKQLGRDGSRILDTQRDVEAKLEAAGYPRDLLSFRLPRLFESGRLSPEHIWLERIVVGTLNFERNSLNGFRFMQLRPFVYVLLGMISCI